MSDEKTVNANVFDDRIDVDTGQTTSEVFTVLQRCLLYVLPEWRLFLLKFCLMVGSFAPLLIVPWPIKVLMDHVIGGEPLASSSVRFPPFFEPFIALVTPLDPTGLLIATLALLLVLIILFGAGAGENRGNYAFLASGQDTATQSEMMISAGWSMAGGFWGLADLLCNIRLVQRVTNRLRTQLFSRLVRMPMHILDNQRIGDSVYRTMYDAPAIQGVCFDVTLMPVVALLGALVSLYVMDYSYSATIPELFWLGLATMPLALLVTAPFAGLARRVSQESRGAGSATTNKIESNISNIAAVQSQGTQSKERDEFAEASETSFQRFRRVVLVNIGIEIAVMVGAIATMGLWVFLLVSDQIIQGELNPGDYATVLGLFMTVAGTSVTFGRLWVDLQHNVAGVRRVFFYLDLPTDEQKPGTQSIPERIETIRFERVGLTYPDGRIALQDVSIEIERDQVLAITGPTGAGKTSFGYLIPRFLEASSGSILLNEVPIQLYRIEDLRRSVRYVFQEHFLFGDTIRSNLIFGYPEATEEQIVAATQQCQIHDFIEGLPDGYETVLGQNASTLSLGQRQRLSLARGLIGSSQVLILDEPTASLDQRTEESVMSNLSDLKLGRIIVVITHRLATMRQADQVMFLGKEGVVKTGTFKELEMTGIISHVQE
ncbi:MAG: ABC transporter ATP-binding protein [Gammaproteobacteria bacterium]|nr:ABC transporter ATP-binding protein [Gammaproteobacteria bacterium]